MVKANPDDRLRKYTREQDDIRLLLEKERSGFISSNVLKAAAFAGIPEALQLHPEPPILSSSSVITGFFELLLNCVNHYKNWPGKSECSLSDIKAAFNVTWSLIKDDRIIKHEDYIPVAEIVDAWLIDPEENLYQYLNRTIGLQRFNYLVAAGMQAPHYYSEMSAYCTALKYLVEKSGNPSYVYPLAMDLASAISWRYHAVPVPDVPFPSMEKWEQQELHKMGQIISRSFLRKNPTGIGKHYFSHIEDNLIKKFGITNLLGCGQWACAWQTESERVCKVTEDVNDAEVALRRAHNENPILSEVLADIDEVLIFNLYRNMGGSLKLNQSDSLDAEEPVFVILSEPLITFDKLLSRTQILAIEDFAQGFYIKSAVKDLEILNDVQLFAITLQLVKSLVRTLPPYKTRFEVEQTFREQHKDFYHLIPEVFVSIAIAKFDDLKQAQKILSIQDNNITLIHDAHYANWGFRDPTNFESIVLFDFGLSNARPIELDRKYASQWRLC